MKFSTLSHIAFAELKNTAAEKFYIRTGADFTKPVQFSGYINKRCNIKCRYCDYWRRSHYDPEMSIEDWQRGLLSLKDLAGQYLIAFSGGEPFIKPGFIDLLLWCRKNGIRTAVTTNGTALNAKNAQRVADSAISQIHISADTPDAETNDFLRGKTGLLKRISNGIGYLREARDRSGQDFPIIVKSTITAGNFRHLPELVKWAQEIGATSVNFSPLHRTTAEAKDELWIKKTDLGDLEKSIDSLLEMKKMGEPIINSARTLRYIPQYFAGTTSKQRIQCHHVTRNFAIQPNGDVQVCFCQAPIGNIREQSAREIWYGERARQVRQEKIGCTRLSYRTPLSKRTMKEKVKTGINILRSKKGNSVFQGKSPRET